MAKIDSETRFARSEGVAHRRVVDEVLIVPVRSSPREEQGIYSLNPTASAIWDLLDGTRTAADLARALAERFDVEPERARADVETLLEDLLSFGAVEAHGDRD